MYVCMYVCMYVRTYVRAYVNDAQTRIHTHSNAYFRFPAVERDKEPLGPYIQDYTFEVPSCHTSCHRHSRTFVLHAAATAHADALVTSCCVCVCAHSLCRAAPFFGVRLLSVHGRQRCVFATGNCLQDLQKVLDVSRLHWGRDPLKFKCPYCHVEDFSANHWCVCPRRDSVGCTIGTARLFHQQLCTSPVEM